MSVSINQELICLDDDDDDDDDDNENNKKIAASNLPSSHSDGPIDLCNSDDEEICILPRRRKRPRRDKTPNDPDAVLVVESNDNNNITNDTMITPDEIYRRVLGPQRMEFIAAFQHSAHAFESAPPPTRLPRTLTSELLEYQLNLPIASHSSIFVRVLESRMDLLRVLITGPVDTPYQHGIYMFDVHLSDYPSTAPKVKFLTTDNGRVRFNPNLYNCGKVCLSLLGTWSGPGWISGQSTLLQVLISIQALILVQEPYYNEPGLEIMRHQSHAKKASRQYSKNIRKQNLIVAILHPLKQVVTNSYIYPEFTSVVQKHFYQQADSIRQKIQEWLMEDPTLTATVAMIDQHLDQLAKEMTKPPETIELLDD